MPYTNEGALICQNALAGVAQAAASRYLALFVGDPTGAGAEVSAAGYARLERTAAQMPRNNNAISINMGEWDDAADESWGTPDYVALMDADSGGNVAVAYAQIAPALAEITTGSRVLHRGRRHHADDPALVTAGL